MELQSETFLEPTSEALDSPHFDDERTLLSARPVVPLTEVAKPRKRRGLHLSAGIGFLAIAVGIAALIQFSRIDSKSQQGSQNATENADGSPQKPLQVANGGEIAGDASANDSHSGTETARPTVAAVARRAEKQPTVVKSAKRTQPAELSVRRIRENDDYWYDSDEQDRRELRRARRAERRARRAERMRDTDDDVFRVTDLFEGARRP